MAAALIGVAVPYVNGQHVPTPLAERVWPRVNKRPDGCWIWTGPVKPHQRPVIAIAVGVDVWRHRMVRELLWEWAGRAMPCDKDMLATSCGNRLCVNPDHATPTTRVAVLRERDKRSLAERFWPRVDRRGLDDCWPWTGAKTPAGYGEMKLPAPASMTVTHRVAWKLTHGEIPDGLWVLHKCDNPPCCNPAHLFLGTAADNTRDMVSKRRQWLQDNPTGASYMWGEKSPKAKLTNAAVRAIRKAKRQGESTSSLARRFNVARITVDRAANRLTWKHI